MAAGTQGVTLPALFRSQAALEPPPDQVVAVHGESTDRSVAIAEVAGLDVVHCLRRGCPPPAQS